MISPQVAAGLSVKSGSYRRCQMLLSTRNGPSGPGIYRLYIITSDDFHDIPNQHGFAYMPRPERIAELPSR
jgi:hypothetical protein